MRHPYVVRAVLRNLIFSPGSGTLPGDPAGFAFGVRLLAGPAGGPGGESVELAVCSPEWLAVRCRSGELVNGLHHVIVGRGTYDERVVRDWLEAQVRAAEAATWAGIASQLPAGQMGVRELSSLIAAEECGTGGSRGRHQMNGISLVVLCEYSA